MGSHVVELAEKALVGLVRAARLPLRREGRVRRHVTWPPDRNLGGPHRRLPLGLTPSVGAPQCLVTSVGTRSCADSSWERRSPEDHRD
jgi:hypothetical protein